ncbi:photosystem II reaction center protein PsbN [Phormidium sp. CCY1219]|jgi:PsbN protein|nr:photosystem II reaction center protein PsbN [Phormidium sp. CCY1219]MEB3829796.1 photosystem II reaction center protein PsbN [Phormidium sp. CCY1219]
MENLEPALVLSIGIVAILLAIVAFSIYTSFGPPSRELVDPFDEHED